MNAFPPTLRLTLVAVLAVCTWAASTVMASEPINERQAADPAGRVEVANISGRVSVLGWDEEEIEITGVLGRGVERLDFVRDGETTHIEVIYPTNGRSSGSTLLIRVPEGSSLDVTTVSADIEITDVLGRQRLGSVSGDVSSQVFGADLEAETVSGGLEVYGDNQTINLALRTVSGDIDTRAVSGELEAGTVSGRIKVAAGMLDRARLGTTSGRISLDGGLAADGRYDLSTTSGRISVMLDQGGDLDVDAQTFSGNIDNCFGIEATRSRYGSERTLRFQEGEANRTIRVRAMSSRIELCSEELSLQAREAGRKSG